MISFKFPTNNNSIRFQTWPHGCMQYLLSNMLRYFTKFQSCNSPIITNLYLHFATKLFMFSTKLFFTLNILNRNFKAYMNFAYFAFRQSLFCTTIFISFLFQLFYFDKAFFNEFEESCTTQNFFILIFLSCPILLQN